MDGAGRDTDRSSRSARASSARPPFPLGVSNLSLPPSPLHLPRRRPEGSSVTEKGGETPTLGVSATVTT